jgi:hypothetical protein
VHLWLESVRFEFLRRFVILTFCGKFRERSAIRCMMEKIFDVIVLGAGERAILNGIVALSSTSGPSGLNAAKR